MKNQHFILFAIFMTELQLLLLLELQLQLCVLKLFVNEEKYLLAIIQPM